MITIDKYFGIALVVLILMCILAPFLINYMVKDLSENVNEPLARKQKLIELELMGAKANSQETKE